ncbi:LOW QUALITY PROTEIN: F-box only protein 36b [Plectropomus leopardus]|uniref:LOW QUALITY PROTEIN: F-box only protein 36b n=1 Tax=Plectropomus leopardus TaxID=160734 RepID=UPI001C4CB9AB|nr:LOW QUALITY PROTEIN: F-box only protein 36b [Plectropomus leopardus]
MASLLPDPLFEISGNGPAPNKNFYYFAITNSEVIWRWWKISPRFVDRYSKPGELKEPHQDFLGDTWLQSEVSMVFGHRILQYTKALCQGHYDYLDRLSDSLLLRIINYLELEDVGQLGRTSHRFRQLCGSEEFWEQAVRRHCSTVSAEVASLALEVGWRSIFFTSKLQLQKLISRRRLKTEEQQEGEVTEPGVMAEGSPDESSETDQISGSEDESHTGIILDPSLGIDPGTGFDTSSCCNVDHDSNPEPEAGSDSSVPALCQLFDDIKTCAMATPVQSSALASSRGDCRAVPDKTMS